MIYKLESKNHSSSIRNVYFYLSRISPRDKTGKYMRLVPMNWCKTTLQHEPMIWEQSGLLWYSTYEHSNNHDHNEQKSKSTRHKCIMTEIPTTLPGRKPEFVITTVYGQTIVKNLTEHLSFPYRFGVTVIFSSLGSFCLPPPLRVQHPFHFHHVTT